MTWPTASAGATVFGQCAQGYFGSTQRTCSPDGIWLAPSGQCLRGSCQDDSDQTAVFRTVPTNTADVAGECLEGYAPTNGQPPSRSCSAEGQWSVTVNPCTRLVCAATTDDDSHAFFRAADSNTPDIVGECLPGFGAGLTPPKRTCQLSGAWGEVEGSCERTFQSRTMVV